MAKMRLPVADDRKKRDKAVKRLLEILDRYTPDDLPKMNSRHPQEASDANWIYTQLDAKYGFRKCGYAVWRPCLETIAKQKGFDDLFVYRSRKQRAIQNIKRIVKEYSPENLPKRDRSKPDSQETKDALWIFKMRRAKDGSGNHIWHPEIEQIANKNGFKGLFDRKRIGKLTEEAYLDYKRRAVKEMNYFVSKYSPDNLPDKYSKDPQERKDYFWWYDKKRAKVGAKEMIWYPELDKIAEDHGFVDLFKVETYADREKKAIGYLNGIIKKYDPKKLPKANGPTYEERRDAAWILRMRRAKAETSECVWYPVLQEIADKNGFKDLFKFVRPTKDMPQEEAYKKRLINFMEKYSIEALPKANSKHKEERQDASWLNRMRQCKKNYSGDKIWYPSLEIMADRNGFKGLFDSKNYKVKSLTKKKK